MDGERWTPENRRSRLICEKWANQCFAALQNNVLAPGDLWARLMSDHSKLSCEKWANQCFAALQNNVLAPGDLWARLMSDRSKCKCAHFRNRIE